METAACPPPDGMITFNKHWKIYIPTTVRDEGNAETRFAAPYNIVSIILPSVSTTNIALAKPTINAPPAIPDIPSTNRSANPLSPNFPNIATTTDIPKNRADISSIYQSKNITPITSNIIVTPTVSKTNLSLLLISLILSKSSVSSRFLSNSCMLLSCGFSLTLPAYLYTYIIVAPVITINIASLKPIPENKGSPAIP